MRYDYGAIYTVSHPWKPQRQARLLLVLDKGAGALVQFMDNMELRYLTYKEKLSEDPLISRYALDAEAIPTIYGDHPDITV